MFDFDASIRHHLEPGVCRTLFGFRVGHPELQPDRPSATFDGSLHDIGYRLRPPKDINDIDRDIIRDGTELLEVDLSEHIQFVIDALKPHAEELGIGGNQHA